MASVDWKKCTTKVIKSSGYRSHFDQNKRIDKNVKHQNNHINKDCTENWSTCSWKEALTSWEKRIKEVDLSLPPQRIRKDRVTAVTLEFVCPEEIEKQGKSKEFFQKAYDVVKNQFGKDDVHGMFVHMDEQHEYYDHSTKKKKMSLNHAHVLVSPFVENKGINGKHFQTRESMIALNNAIDKMCVREFNIGYLTHGEAMRKSVEMLKADQLLDEIEGLKLEINSLRQRKAKGEKAIDDFVETYTSSYIQESSNRILDMIPVYDKNGNNLDMSMLDAINLISEGNLNLLDLLPVFDKNGNLIGDSLLDVINEVLKNNIHQNLDEINLDSDEDLLKQ